MCCLNRKVTVLFLPKADVLNEIEMLIQACRSLFVLRHFTQNTYLKFISYAVLEFCSAHPLLAIY